MSLNEILVTVALILLASLLALIVHVRTLATTEVDAAKRREIQKLEKIVAATEELLAGASLIPYSPILMVVLHTRISDALKEIADRGGEMKNLQARIASEEEKIAALSSSREFSIKSLKSHENDARAIRMLRLLKRIKNVLRSQYGKGRIDTSSYIGENERLESLKVQIIIENAIKRSSNAMSSGNELLARQLLQKAMKVVSALNDDYSIRIFPELEKKLVEVEKRASDAKNHQPEAEKKQLKQKQRELEIEQLFDERKRVWYER